MVVIFILQVIVCITVAYYFYNRGYTKGAKAGREDERARYKDEIKVATKQVVAED